VKGCGEQKRLGYQVCDAHLNAGGGGGGGATTMTASLASASPPPMRRSSPTLQQTSFLSDPLGRIAALWPGRETPALVTVA